MWFKILNIALALVAPAVHAISAISTEAHDGATKRQLAIDSVMQGANVASFILKPDDQVKAAAVAHLVGHAIDATVASSKLDAVPVITTDAVQALGVATGAIPVAGTK